MSLALFTVPLDRGINPAAQAYEHTQHAHTDNPRHHLQITHKETPIPEVAARAMAIHPSCLSARLESESIADPRNSFNVRRMRAEFSAQRRDMLVSGTIKNVGSFTPNCLQ